MAAAWLRLVGREAMDSSEGKEWGREVEGNGGREAGMDAMEPW